MACYVLLVKETETNDEVVYRFGANETETGRIRFDKHDGEAKILEPAPVENSSALSTRAIVKLHRHWKEGVFPEKTCWAS